MSDLALNLQKYFGYTEFRPLQEEIISDILSHKDVFVLMPTGGGKSLCYQLPAVMQDGLTIVISPLISLMKDQVDALKQNGIAAEFLNSTLSAKEQEKIIEQLKQNKISLLYVAPERVMQNSFYEFLKKLNISLFAIDEAHCISEWGHDFRAEYRMLSVLKKDFPAVPIAALTATATDRVRGDIVSSLEIQNATKYVASFNRQNLSYEVREKKHTFDQLVQFIQEHPKQSGIIYCQSRKSVENVAESLQKLGINALPYHAKLDDKTRRVNQEKFIRDDAEIIVATIAFGMGIDKPNVRYVIHYDLPANLERYYQETGRAGRDGLPSSCILFFSYGDIRGIEYFIRQKELEQEQKIAKELLKQMLRFAEAPICRRKILLEYFGEIWEQKNCENCDNCLNIRGTFDGTIIAQKIFSCVYKTGERFGIQYITDMLSGTATEKIVQNNHDTISTFGLIPEYSKKQISSFIRELIMLEYLGQTDSEYPTVFLKTKGKLMLKNKEKVLLIKPQETAKITKKVSQTKDYDTELFEILRAVRKQIADEENVPPYIVFSDATLADMSKYYPQNLEQFSQVSGVGSQKLERYGKQFIKYIKEYCEGKGIAPRERTEFKRERKEKSGISNAKRALRLFQNGLSISEIAEKLGIKQQTVSGYLVEAYMGGEKFNVNDFVSKEKQKIISEAIRKIGMERLTPIKNDLGDEYSFDEIRWVRAMMMKES